MKTKSIYDRIKEMDKACDDVRAALNEIKTAARNIEDQIPEYRENRNRDGTTLYFSVGEARSLEDDAIAIDRALAVLVDDWKEDPKTRGPEAHL